MRLRLTEFRKLITGLFLLTIPRLLSLSSEQAETALLFTSPTAFLLLQLRVQGLYP